MAYPTKTFQTFAQLWAEINSVWITNGNYEITGEIGNYIVDGLLTFIEQSPRNWKKANVFSNGAPVVANYPFNIFMTTIPASLTWIDNIYNEYIFINTINASIPLLNVVYYDINLNIVNNIPAKSIVKIAKASNDLWIVCSVPSAGSQSALPPLTGIVGSGGADDPIAGSTTFQNGKLIGIGTANAGRIQMMLAETLYSNYGSNASFTINNVTGTITLLGGNTFPSGASIYIDLNQ